MCSATTADDADACETIMDDLAESLSADRSDGRLRREEEASSVTGRTDVRHEPGHHDACRQPRPTPAIRLGDEEERPQPLSVIMCRSPVPGSAPMFRRNYFVDIDNTDVDER